MIEKTTEHLYIYPWETVTSAFWNKYPNENLKHVESVDVLQRVVDEQGRLHTKRLAVVKQDVPGWAESLLGKNAFMYEETLVDPKKKTMKVMTKNLSYASVATVEERCTYSVHPDNPGWTRFQQDASVRAYVPFLSKSLESFSVKAGTEGLKKGLKAMESICESIINGTLANSSSESVEVR